MALSAARPAHRRALAALYGAGEGERSARAAAASAPRPRSVARWLGDIREFFPAPVVQVIQRDAFERLGPQAMLLEPELLATLEADVHLVADLISLRGAMPDKTKETARLVVAKVVDELIERLRAQDRRGDPRRARPRQAHAPAAPADIDWPRTIQRQPEALAGRPPHDHSREAGRLSAGSAPWSTSTRSSCASTNRARWRARSSMPRSSRR